MDPKNEPTKNETLFGGIDLTVKLLNGTTEAVKVRQLPVRLYPQYVAVMENEPAMAELLCGKPAGWSDTLDPESFEKIILEGERINADFFGRWYQRLLTRQEKLIPGIVEQRKAEVLRLQTSSQKSPSP